MRITSRFAVLTLIAAVFTVIPAASAEEIVLFDGTNLDQWRGYNKEDVPAAWQIEEGALTLNGKGGDLMTKEKFDNFELSFEWKISPGGNSGVIYRVKEQQGQPSYKTGPEYQVLDDGPGGNNSKHGAAALYDLYAPEGKTSKPAGEWNTAKIVINNGKVEHWINGAKVVETEIGGNDWNERVDNSKFKTWENFGKITPGHICLQDHGNRVWYRDIKVKKLTE